jgi:hypothetical protein
VALAATLQEAVGLLEQAERAVRSRDRLRRLVHLGLLSWQQLGLGGARVCVAMPGRGDAVRADLTSRAARPVPSRRAPAVRRAPVPSVLAAPASHDSYDASLRDIMLLKGQARRRRSCEGNMPRLPASCTPIPLHALMQVSALSALLSEMGLWPALALATADIFGGATDGASTRLREEEPGSTPSAPSSAAEDSVPDDEPEPEDLAVEDLLQLSEPADLGKAPNPEDGRKAL